MADVFLLGAGCSKAISPAMPVVAELIEPLADHLDDQVAARYGTTLRNIRDLEAVLTGWAEPQPPFVLVADLLSGFPLINGL